LAAGDSNETGLESPPWFLYRTDIDRLFKKSKEISN
jgi:hypothetical protein